MSNEETWEPASRVVFKPNSGFEQRIVVGNEENRMAVCVKARLLRLTPTRRVSLDLVESHDLLELTCPDCGKGLGAPRREWYEEYNSRRCVGCEAAREAESKKQQEEYIAKRDRDMNRRDSILAAMSAEDRELFRR